MAIDWLQRDRRASHSEFARRHVFYSSLDRDLQAHTGFFAAAALTNRMFASLFEWGLNWVSAATYDFLNKLGAELEGTNRCFAAEIRRGVTADVSLDTRLVAEEQRIAQAHLETSRLRIATWPGISRELNGLLNGTHIASRVAPLLSHSRRYRAVLAEVRRQMGVGLDFADESHRVTIGCTLIRHLRSGRPAHDEIPSRLGHRARRGEAQAEAHGKRGGEDPQSGPFVVLV
jgi:hypothetical protein